ncbi:hypothetical protein GUITHDRAFT_157754 [Guillardia theta CCMP2712]|uniref:RING finger and CHY zinc finger domain-containing protein 1 n=1 Tax=Guillardia theta (strain CCMP2712) TaxID=905079 RepID=L1JCI4_GUITC|nr:hypothetical protein GUITHDRAFT_157754 [Guillardia theta CCMP2712]EKX46241.1 hypothetical protein GUITHDRAFT_157754 [Guillardia theta CCMP2712]|eukprot:XP_005833221.1 hypothetical protein GUITHDRAFT_157754 [Guillardia theta CCMP2712]
MKHYSRGCQLVGPCCQKTFWCRFCHDEASDHAIDRHAVKEVKCAECGLVQPVGPACIGQECGNAFGKYFCSICNFFDDNISGEPFHCDGCGICRKGGRENFFHCDTCGCCYSNALRDQHRCIQQNMHRNCPVCLEDLFTSTTVCKILRCGHAIHSTCLHSMLRSRTQLLRCPICMVSIGDPSRHWTLIDEEVAQVPMPEEYRDMKVVVLCNDCSATGETPFHVLGLKCPNKDCGSYNTRRL